MELLQAYHWPGNVRQLHNLLRTAAVMVEDDCVIRLEHLPDDFLDELRTPLRSPMVAPPVHAAEPPLMPSVGAPPVPDDMADDSQSLQDVTINAMAQMLRLHKGNVSAAAKALGVSRNTIYRKKNLLPPDLLD
jgi:transcriptional regulator of acetoin/glycerol metabolism